MTGSKTLYILRGIPASGKSTWMIQEWPALGSVNCSSDDFFKNREFDPRLLGESHAACMAKVIENLHKQHPCIIVDNTHSRLWEFANYLKLGEAFDRCVQVLRFDTPLENCLRRNAKREHPVPPGIIAEMWLRFEDFEGEQLASNFSMQM